MSTAPALCIVIHGRIEVGVAARIFYQNVRLAAQRGAESGDLGRVGGVAHDAACAELTRGTVQGLRVAAGDRDGGRRRIGNLCGRPSPPAAAAGR